MATRTDKDKLQTEGGCLFCTKPSGNVPPPRRSANTLNKKKYTQIETSTNDACSVEQPLLIPFKKPLKPGAEIGRGAYGRVFEVEYKGTHYAAKEVHTILLESAAQGHADGLNKLRDNFLHECHIWSQLQHPCIVQFIGIYHPTKDKFKVPVIVLEKMQFSLSGIVEKHSDFSVNSVSKMQTILNILNDICFGLQYLHSRNPPIVHRDLTPNNILLCHHLRAKITDLGVARTLETTNTKTLTKGPGTPDFMPPECMTDKPVYGLPLDMFSFGGIILFVTTRRWPTPSSYICFTPDTHEKIYLTELQRRQQYLDQMTGAHVDIKPLAISCLDDDPEKRPTPLNALMEIKELKKKYSDYFDIWIEEEQLPHSEQLKQNQQQEKEQQQQQQQWEQQSIKDEQEQKLETQQNQQIQPNKHQQHSASSQPKSTVDGEKFKEITKSKDHDSLLTGKTKYLMTELEDQLTYGKLNCDTKCPPVPMRASSQHEVNHPLYVARHDFFSEKDEELNFKKGEMLYIINKDEGNWWFARAKLSGEEGYVPINYVTKFRPPKTDPKVTSYPLYIARFDYYSQEDKYLNIKKGDLLYMLNTTLGDWWFARAKDSGQEGYVPNNYVAKINTLDAEDWFFGAVTRKCAENLLMQSFNDCGSFLVRNSETSPGDYALSIRFENGVRHYKIKQNSNGYCVSNWRATFESISKLVTHYTTKSDGLCVTLKNTCLITEPQTVSSSEETNEAWEIERNSIQTIKKLGGGQFGEVWQAIWNGITKLEVAVKQLTLGTISANEFSQEAALMFQLKHPNLVQLYGVCTKEEPIYIITELMKYGSLLEYLRGDGRSLKLPQLLKMGAQVAAGMAYLEKKNYVHRDLAARNILVSDNLICKVESVSMARILSEDIYEIYTGAKFPIKWTAPEAAIYNYFTIKSDVWSFGILLYELITHGRNPYIGINDAQVIKVLQNGYRMPCPMGCPEPLYELIRECWKYDAASRPTFERLYWSTEDYFVENEPTHMYPDQV